MPEEFNFDPDIMELKEEIKGMQQEFVELHKSSDAIKNLSKCVGRGRCRLLPPKRLSWSPESASVPLAPAPRAPLCQEFTRSLHILNPDVRPAADCHPRLPCLLPTNLLDTT